MRPRFLPAARRAFDKAPRIAGHLTGDERGTTAIEFGIVALPFLMFMFGVIGVGMHFFTINTVEHATEAAARKIRTGQAQAAGMTVGEFKQSICDEATSFIECNANLQVHIQHASEWSGISPQACKDGSNLAVAAGAAASPLSDLSGEESEAVLITVCYKWDLPAAIPFITLGDPDLGGAAIIQAATTFRTEPYQ